MARWETDQKSLSLSANLVAARTLSLEARDVPWRTLETQRPLTPGTHLMGRSNQGSSPRRCTSERVEFACGCSWKASIPIKSTLWSRR